MYNEKGQKKKKEKDIKFFLSVSIWTVQILYSAVDKPQTSKIKNV